MTKSKVATFSGRVFNTEEFKQMSDRSGFIQTIFQIYIENKGLINSLYKAYNDTIEASEADVLRFYMSKSSELLNNPILKPMFLEDIKRHKEGVL